MRGLLNNKQFNLFFDWFYPQYLSVVMEGTLNAFHDDDDTVHACIKLLCELVNNRNNRVRFDTWNINGLVVFKEASKYVIQLLTHWDSLQQKPLTQDAFKSKWKYVKEICLLFQNVVCGSYINFAICEYYNDNTFTQLTQLVIKMIVSLDRQQLKLYQKVENVVYNMLASFFKNHLELIFMKFDRHLLEELFRCVTAGLDNSVFEV